MIIDMANAASKLEGTKAKGSGIHLVWLVRYLLSCMPVCPVYCIHTVE